jgi:hypothetical protein
VSARRRSHLVAAAVVVLAALAGCRPSAPGISNGAVSTCYRALPVADSALRTSSAKLIGVHRIPGNQVARRLKALAPTATTTPQADLDDPVCAFAFQGNFAAGQVLLARPDAQGHYAVVLVTSRNLKPVGAFVINHLPRSFGGRVV